jgi:hypothetical protein
MLQQVYSGQILQKKMYSVMINNKENSSDTCDIIETQTSIFRLYVNYAFSLKQKMAIFQLKSSIIIYNERVKQKEIERSTTMPTSN